MRLFIFHRAEGWYPLELPDTQTDLMDNIAINPGTLKVTDGITGEVIWEAV